MPDAQALATKRSPNYLVRKQNRSATTITLLKASLGQLAYGVELRLRALKRDFKTERDKDRRMKLADCCLRHEEMIQRIVGHPLPGRARVTQATMRTLDVEPISMELSPPPMPLDSGLDSPPNGAAESLANPVESD